MFLQRRPLPIWTFAPALCGFYPSGTVRRLGRIPAALACAMLLGAALALAAWLWSRPAMQSAQAAPSATNVGARAQLRAARSSALLADAAPTSVANEHDAAPGTRPPGRAVQQAEAAPEPAPVMGLEEAGLSAASPPRDQFWRKYEERTHEELERALREVRAAKDLWLAARSQPNAEPSRETSVALQQLERLEAEQAWLEARLAQTNSGSLTRP